MAKNRRLLWQLFPSYLLIILISLLVVTWFASRSLRHFYLEQTTSDLEARARLLEAQIREYLDPVNREAIDLWCKKTCKRAFTRVTIMLPSVMLSGFIFPQESMPLFIYYLGQIVPATYLIRILRGIVLRGAGFADLWQNGLILLVMGIVVLTLSTTRFHKTLE